MAIDIKDVSLAGSIDEKAGAGTEKEALGRKAAGRETEVGPRTEMRPAVDGERQAAVGAESELVAGTERDAAAGSGKRARGRFWIYKPAIDLAIGCAGWSAPLLLLLYFTADIGPTLSIVFYGLALLFNYPHYSATIYRAYRTREDFSRYRVFTIHLTLLIALAGGIAHWSAWLIPWVFTLYITWSPWHYSGQNFGLAMMFARRAGVKPTRVERNALFISFLASYALIFLTMHTGTSSDPYVLSLGLPVDLSEAVRAVLACVFALTGPWVLYRLARRGGWRLIVAPATLFATQFLWFVLPFVLQLAYKIEIPQTRYSTGILAVMHSAQYLWITSYYARREAVASGAERWKARSYFGALILGGIALFLPGPWLISYVFHYDFTSSVLIFTAIVNIHHFLLDGAIWKLRESRIAALLISPGAKVTSPRAGSARSPESPPRRPDELAGYAERMAGRAEDQETSPKRGREGGEYPHKTPIFSRLGWVGSGRPSARAFRLGAAVLLVILAVLDQARFFLAVDASDRTSLSQAERLNPYDEPVRARLGRAQASTGDADRAVDEFRRAVELNPRDAEARAGLVKALVENERYEEAYDEYKRMAAYIKSEPDSLVNFGILAERLGHRDEAIETWKRTVAMAPDTKSAHLYLADALYDDGKKQEAIPHYEQYLALLTSAPEALLDPQEVIRVALRIGDVYTDSQDFDRALIFYHKAADIAKQTGIKGLESLTLEHAANLYAIGGQLVQSAELYRRALRLDAEGKDDKAEGLDWFAYAQFLNDAGQPKTLVLACTLKAQGLLTANPGDEQGLMKRYQETLEASLGSEAVEKVRRDRDSLADQSLEIKFER